MTDPLFQKRILFLSPMAPYPLVGGGQARMLSIASALRSFCSVHYVTALPSLSEEATKWASNNGITIVHHPLLSPEGVRLWLERIRAILLRSSLRRDRTFARYFDSQVAVTQPDVVWCETPYLARYALKWRKTLPIIIDYWGTSQGQERDWRQARGMKKIWEWFRWKTIKGAEQRCAPQARALVTVSSIDADHFRRIAPDSLIRIIPSGINSPLPPEETLYDKEENNLLMMTGNLSYRPNVDAACFFVRSILPQIRQTLPDIRCAFIGRDPGLEVLALSSNPRIEVKGFIPDLASEIARAAVFVLPMRLGSGYRSKLFDVFPLGKAIVTTSIGAEGLELADGHNCIMADDPALFADACIRLLQDVSKRRGLGANARRLAREVYTQAHVEELLRPLLAEVTGGL